MDAKSIKLLEQKIAFVKKLILDSNEITEESKLRRIKELTALEKEIDAMK